MILNNYRLRSSELSMFHVDAVQAGGIALATAGDVHFSCTAAATQLTWPGSIPFIVFTSLKIRHFT